MSMPGTETESSNGAGPVWCSKRRTRAAATVDVNQDGAESLCRDSAGARWHRGPGNRSSPSQRSPSPVTRPSSVERVSGTCRRAPDVLPSSTLTVADGAQDVQQARATIDVAPLSARRSSGRRPRPTVSDHSGLSGTPSRPARSSSRSGRGSLRSRGPRRGTERRAVETASESPCSSNHEASCRQPSSWDRWRLMASVTARSSARSRTSQEKVLIQAACAVRSEGARCALGRARAFRRLDALLPGAREPGADVHRRRLARAPLDRRRAAAGRLSRRRRRPPIAPSLVLAHHRSLGAGNRLPET